MSYLALFQMTLRGIHTVLCLILALLYVVERGMPCVDDCASNENDPHAQEQVLHADEGHDAGDSDEHHCDHCTCVCHVPALASNHSNETSRFNPSVVGSTYLISIPTASVSPPDHVPLA